MRKIVIGGGAAGLVAALAAAERGHEVILLEKNEKLGKKIYITGKGRCNLTNDCPPDEFLHNVVRGSKFLTGAIYRFSPADMMELLESHGLMLKTERGRRVFPASDKASDVTKTLEKACLNAGVDIRLGVEVTEIDILQGTVRGVITSDGAIPGDAVVVATGGLSYPSTGSTGDGYKFATAAGHMLTPCVPSLVGIEAKEVAAAQGISLKNCVLTAERGIQTPPSAAIDGSSLLKGVSRGKIISSELGELLFTHYGISGPLVLTLSARINRIPMKEVSLSLDFKPALDDKQLDARLVRDFTERKNERMKNVMRGLLPAGLVPLVLAAAEISPEKQANGVTREERMRLVAALKRFPIRPTGLRGYTEAVVTSGGVDVKEIDPKTMQSKKVKGLYFAGEVLDVDAFTGGFNLQIAFSTGFLAGIAE